MPWIRFRSRVHRWLSPLRDYPVIWDGLRALDLRIDRGRQATARMLPVLVRPAPRRLQVAITAQCNLRCIGCRYGRDFMPNSQLPLPLVEQLLADAGQAGVREVRFYGGEPLLHRDLPRMLERTIELGMQPWVTTNAILLEERIDELYAAGLRQITVGYYGTGADYDAYVQRRNRYARLEAGFAAVRDRYGTDVSLRINWLLMRPSCTVADLDAACGFAERFGAEIQVDLVHYSLPYFSEGPDRMLQFRAEDRPAIEAVVSELVRRKEAHPKRFRQSLAGLKSIPDWLVLGPAMRVPCDSHEMLWVGADGTVQQCYVTFPLGNLHQQPLRELLFTDAHRRAARDSFELNCPNCHCNYDRRIDKHGPAVARYG